MKKNKYIVYMHKFQNGKVYVGITSQSPKHRWNNGKGYSNNIFMTNAIKKYGWENIEHIILFKNLTKEEAEQKEIELIAYYKSNNKKYGYNILDGGNVSNGLTKDIINKMSSITKELWQTEEYRKKVTNAHIGIKPNEETKKKMSQNNAKYWQGKNLSEETKRKLSESLKGRIAWNKGTKGIMKANKTSFKKGQASVNRKKVECIETKIIYDSILEASIKTNTNQTCIVNVCKGKQNIAGGYHWKYV